MDSIQPSSNVESARAKPASPDACWAAYLAWLEAEPPARHPDELMARYLDHLAASRAEPRSMAAAIDAIAGRLQDEPEEWRHVFNNVYRSATPACSTRPNGFLRRVAGAIPPGAALDIGMGQGRNSLFVAARGWQVTGFDTAEVGLAAAQRQALSAGLEIRTVWCSERMFPYGTDAWDLIVATYCPLPLQSSRFVSSIKRALRPGGLLLVESFARDSPAGPHRLGIDVAAGALAAAFADFDVLHDEETTGVADWGGTESALIRFLARRLTGQGPDDCIPAF